MPELFVRSGSYRLWTESFGNYSNPPILLMHGSGCQGIMWPDDFCDVLAYYGFFVIRYDNRDTGLSSIIDYDIAPYDLNDLANDAISILDAYNLPTAHIVGASMGGFIGQILAIKHPEKVASLTSISSGPYKPILPNENGEFITNCSLPPPNAELLNFLANESKQKPITIQDYINQEIRIWQACNGQGEDFDEGIVMNQQIKVFSRTDLSNIAAAENHIQAIECACDRTTDLKKIIAPTLVVHGDKDPLLPLEHGIVTAKNIPNAKLIVIKNMGHIFPFKRSGCLAQLIVRHALDTLSVFSIPK